MPIRTNIKKHEVNTTPQINQPHSTYNTKFEANSFNQDTEYIQEINMKLTAEAGFEEADIQGIK